jgi:hypothetical protein
LADVVGSRASRFEVGLHAPCGRVVWARVALTARVGDDGGSAGALAMVADVTEQRSIEAQLRQAQKLDAVGQLAGGLAHDFNNLLTVIDGYAALLIVESDETTARDLATIRDAAARASGLTGSSNRCWSTWRSTPVTRCPAAGLSPSVPTGSPFPAGGPTRWPPRRASTCGSPSRTPAAA